jgi:hypothetical protein
VDARHDVGGGELQRVGEQVLDQDLQLHRVADHRRQWVSAHHRPTPLDVGRQRRDRGADDVVERNLCGRRSGTIEPAVREQALDHLLHPVGAGHDRRDHVPALLVELVAIRGGEELAEPDDNV